MYVTKLLLQGFQCVIICLFRHGSALGFSFYLLRQYTSSSFHCFIICLLAIASLLCSLHRLYHLLFIMSLSYFLKVSIVSLSVCYVTALLSASIIPSSVCYATILFLQGFHCSVIGLLRHCSVLVFSCLLFDLLRQYIFKFPLFHYLFVTSLHCSGLRLFNLLIVTARYL